MTVPHPLPTLYGLKQCDSCRRARRLLDELGVTYRFVDVRADATDQQGHLDNTLLTQWMNAVPWETLVNRRSTTWRQLDAADREGLDADKARTLLRQHPTLLKRPLLMTEHDVTVGIDEARYAALV